jgi:hypothetical protein
MRDRTRELASRACLSIGALLPYWPLLTLRTIYVTDDVFASDIFNGELPGRVLIGQLLRRGEWPVWTSALCSGLPLAGSPADPLGLAAFAFLPPATALGVFVIALLLVAAHGTYALARWMGADRVGAVLAGIAFAGSGYFACQLKHLAIIATVAWLPVGLLLIAKAFDSSTVNGPDEDVADRHRSLRGPARRAGLLAAFGLVVSVQALSGFPQSLYICALVYGACALFGALLSPLRLPGRLAILAGAGLAVVLGLLAGAVVLLPLAELARVSDRGTPPTWEWASHLAYWVPNVMTFLVPYWNGDFSNLTYRGPTTSIFWEDYGYVGGATFLLAVYGGAKHWRRPVVAGTIALTVTAFLIVLGPATPIFKLAYVALPGMNLFRFPTRFLVVVDLGLALLAASGVTWLRGYLEGRATSRSVKPGAIAVALCAITALDLMVHNGRQNPMVPGQEWLAAPPSVNAVAADRADTRTYTPGTTALHVEAVIRARGWVDTRPYFELRDVLQPNTGGGFWNVPSADCYAGVSARWHVDVWGDHNRRAALVPSLVKVDIEKRTLRLEPSIVPLLRAYGVTHVLTGYPQQGAALGDARRAGHAYVYRVDGAARVRFVRAARVVRTEREAAERLLQPQFDPDREILLHEVPGPVSPLVRDGDTPTAAAASARAVITHEDSRSLVIDADTSEDGFLLVADTFYPGWTARVDGAPTPMYRANVSVRGIPLPRGRHEVRFAYDPPGYFTGLRISVAAVALLLLWIAGAAWLHWLHR